MKKYEETKSIFKETEQWRQAKVGEKSGGGGAIHQVQRAIKETLHRFIRKVISDASISVSYSISNIRGI